MLVLVSTAFAQPAQGGARVVPEVHHDTSIPLWQMPPAPRAQGKRVYPVLPLPRQGRKGVADPVVQSVQLLPLAPTTLLNFDGVGNGFTGPLGTFTVTGAPSDANGRVGPNHYVQTVNTDFAIFNKSGTAIYGPAPVNTLWSGFGGGCETNNDGDPVVLYDPIADRWLISQFSVSTTPYLECVAVSTSPDPTGTWNRYSFSNPSFPDYPKIGVWPDAYYATFNYFNGSGGAFLGGEVCAYDRTKMLAGQPATQQCFSAGSTYGGLLPADLDGARQPPPGSPNYLLALGADGQLAFWTFHVDWTTPSNSTFTGPTTLNTAAYTLPCGDTGGTCVPQNGTTQQLDTLGDRLMFRLTYRNFGDHEALVANHSVTAGSSVGVRWYELRLSPTHDATIYQQGTYAPDSNYRWMGSIAMDQFGNIALGFSLSGTAINPQIHYTGRLAGDASGVMSQGESTLINGGGSQTGSSPLTRWGDYSAMAVDPSDDCTFWYTNQYIPADGEFNWSTRIGSFSFAGCPSNVTNDFSISANPSSLSVASGGTSGSSTISTAVISGSAGPVALAVSGAPAGATVTLSPPSVTAGASAVLTVSAGTAVAGSYTLIVTGTEGSVTHTTPVALTVTAAPDFSISANPSSLSVASGGASGTSTISTAQLSGSAATVTLAVSGAPAGATVTLSPPSVTAGASAVLTVSAGTAVAGSYTLIVTGTEGSVTHTTPVALTVTADADLVIAKTSDKTSYKPSSVVTYTVSVTNNGPSDALAVIVTDNLPATDGARYQSDTGGCTHNTSQPTILTCKLGNMPVGTSKSFQIYERISGNQGTVTNTASVTSSTPDPNTANNTATRIVTVGSGS
jgi:uncharacterized repeat protein (TIGR01451 family)